jgi:hypothetical protein
MEDDNYTPQTTADDADAPVMPTADPDDANDYGPVDPLADRRHEETGELIDPPVIPEFEARIHAAQMRADEDAILDAQEDYAAAREELARRHIERANAREEDAS